MDLQDEINIECIRFSTAGTPEKRREHLEKMAKLKEQVSEEEIERQEIEKGLR